MAINTTQIAASGSYIAISSGNGTLTTALLDVINELEAQGAPINMTQISISHDETAAKKYTVVAIVKRH